MLSLIKKDKNNYNKHDICISRKMIMLKIVINYNNNTNKFYKSGVKYLILSFLTNYYNYIKFLFILIFLRTIFYTIIKLYLLLSYFK